ncbi:MAG TPA: ABC transporter permease [Gemmatimonadales bacterium]|jgi:putative ABC transport system permease protein|nr:ABC transporter permease [Gemmatimonadales bacterium]
MTTFFQDIRYALRSFRKSPGFTLTALLTVALGVGANTAIFSVVNGVLLRPLPLGDPARVVLVGHIYKSINLSTGVSGAGYKYYHEQNRVFEKAAGFTNWEANLANGSEPERLVGQQATAEYFAALGIGPVLGRGFTPDEEVPGADKVLVLSEGLWTRDFGRDPGILGKSLVVNGEAHQVVGVMPNGFQFGTDPIAIWKPLALTPQQLDPNCWGCEFMAMVARLKPGTTLDAAQKDLDRLAGQVRELQRTGRDSDWGLYTKAATEQVVGSIRPALLVLMGAVGFVLLIACANLANLLLARATSRQREIAVRTAMGASRWRLARQLLTESVLLSVIGGTAGLAIAFGAVRALVASNPMHMPRMDAVGLDGSVLVFTGGITLVLGILFGLAPAIQAARPALHGMLKEGMRGSQRGGGLRATLVVSEVALAIVLLVGAGLMMKSFRRWVSVDPGFNPERVLTFGVSLPNSKYPTAEQQVAFFDRLRHDLAALPGVVSVGGNVALPMSNNNWTRSFRVEGYQPPPKANGPWGDYRTVTPGYFAAMGIPVKHGREFDESDVAKGRLVAVVDEVLANKYWPGQDPIGKRVGFGGDASPTWLEVVGVVGHVMQNTPKDDEHTQLYQAFAQASFTQLGLVLKTRGDPLAMVPAVRKLVLSLDPQQPIFDVRAMEERLSGSSSQPRFLSLLLGLFAAVAATLAAVGIYGVMSYTVAQQTRELGIRMALGAETGSVLRLVLSRGLVLAGIGIALGVGGSLALGKVMATQLFQTKAADPVVFGAVSLGLVGVALLATLIPARRAMRVDPIVALRSE